MYFSKINGFVRVLCAKCTYFLHLKIQFKLIKNFIKILQISRDLHAHKRSLTAYEFVYFFLNFIQISLLFKYPQTMSELNQNRQPTFPRPP